MRKFTVVKKAWWNRNTVHGSPKEKIILLKRFSQNSETILAWIWIKRIFFEEKKRIFFHIFLKSNTSISKIGGVLCQNFIILFGGSRPGTWAVDWSCATATVRRGPSGHGLKDAHEPVEPASLTKLPTELGPVWQGSGSFKNSSGSGSSDGAASLVELEPF